MSVQQSDQFCEVYDKFMDQYNTGKPVSEITKDILSNFLNQFDDNDGIMHDVYFALAKAEWMCCEQSEIILNRVRTIISYDHNLEFYKDLGATKSDLALRKKKLNQFWESLQNPRKAPKRRCRPPKDKELPSVNPGDCLAYKFEDGFRIAIILDRYKRQGWREQVLVCVLREKFSSFEIAYLDERVGYVNAYIAEEFLPKSKIKKITKLMLPENIATKFFGPTKLGMGLKKHLYNSFTMTFEITLSELIRQLDSEKVDPSQFEYLYRGYGRVIEVRGNDRSV